MRGPGTMDAGRREWLTFFLVFGGLGAALGYVFWRLDSEPPFELRLVVFALVFAPLATISTIAVARGWTVPADDAGPRGRWRLAGLLVFEMGITISALKPIPPAPYLEGLATPLIYAGVVIGYLQNWWARRERSRRDATGNRLVR